MATELEALDLRIMREVSRFLRGRHGPEGEVRLHAVDQSLVVWALIPYARHRESASAIRERIAWLILNGFLTTVEVDAVTQWRPFTREDGQIVSFRMSEQGFIAALGRMLLFQDFRDWRTGPTRGVVLTESGWASIRDDGDGVSAIQTPDAISPEARALALLAEHPEWTDVNIARAVGVSRTQLYRWPRFRTARAAMGRRPRDEGGGEVSQ